MVDMVIRSSNTADRWCTSVQNLNGDVNTTLEEVRKILNTLAGSDEGTIAKQVYDTTGVFEEAFEQMGRAFGSFVDDVLDWLKENKDTVETVVNAVSTATTIIGRL